MGWLWKTFLSFIDNTLRNVTIWLIIPLSISLMRISFSLFPASDAEFAITSAARPFSFSEVANILIQR